MKFKLLAKIVIILITIAQPTDKYENITREEVEYVAQVVEAESYNQGMQGMTYVADCILNRYDTGAYKDLYGVVNAPGQFSVVAYGTYAKWEPETEVVEMIYEELYDRDSYEIKYFRTGTYHSFGTPCFQYKEHYFSK